jgi:hypothetical protein
MQHAYSTATMNDHDDLGTFSLTDLRLLLILTLRGGNPQFAPLLAALANEIFRREQEAMVVTGTQSPSQH